MLNSRQSLARGDIVRVRRAVDHDGWVTGRVLLASLASPNSQSVAVELDGLVRGAGGLIGGVLPLSIDFELERITSLVGEEYELEILRR
jgi:hypothetical protein